MSIPSVKVGVVEAAQPSPSSIRAGRAQGLGNPASAQERGEVSQSPSGISTELEYGEIGLWIFKGVGARDYVRRGFPPEYHKELHALDEKYDRQIDFLRKKIRNYERKIRELENRRWTEIRELQRKYLEREGFILLG
jgi:hypothetical protein